MPSLALGTALKSAAELFQRLTTVQAHEAKLTVGLDVGSTSVKAVALGARKGAGPRPIIGQSLSPLSAEKERDPSDAIRAAVEGLHAPVAGVNLAVSGPWVIMRIIELPTMKPHELKQALPFEAQRYLPFNIQDVILDGAALGPSEGNKTWVLIVACKKELLDRRIDWAKRAGLNVELVDVDALALTNGFLAGADSHSAERTRALINVGAQLTTLVILRGDVPYLMRDIPWGGEKLARHVSEQMGLQAEVVSQELTKAEPRPEMPNALKLSSEALVTELQLSFDYFENRFNQPPEEIFVSGGLSQSNAFLNALKSQITQPLTPWAPRPDLSGQFAVAYGLALRAD
ncbi:MAG: pilus assembly protein PilM [Candidatus Omnitrophica bacterium]|nr:pilus assembly protein PilM [Candidatus Omnitrophota bacterium]MBI3021498.1 pilus assembly protein PilM [Candidatus Omnitrophota bacterium]